MNEITVSTQYDGRSRRGKTKKCLNCDEPFWAPLHTFEKRKFCSTPCGHSHKHMANSTLVKCANCDAGFRKKNSAMKGSKSGLYFCSRECKDEAQKIGGIRKIMPSHFGYCEKMDDNTKEQVYADYGSVGARTRIARHARESYIRTGQKTICEVCGYDFYVEVCHIKPVKDFDKSAFISEVNHVNNLVFMCPNHHKEFDRGKISKDNVLKIGHGR